MVHEDASHRLRRDGEELRAALPSGVVLIVEAQPCLVHEGRRLERVTVAFASQSAVRLAPQLRIDEARERLGRRRVTTAPGPEELGEVRVPGGCRWW
jgi:hypothetical protein